MKLKNKNCTGAMTTAKNEVFIGLLHETCYLVGGINLWWGGGDKNLLGQESTRGGFCQVRRGMSNPPVGKTLNSILISHD